MQSVARRIVIDRGDLFPVAELAIDLNLSRSRSFGRGRESFEAANVLSTRVVQGEEHVHFMVSTAGDLTPHTDNDWMILLIDTDQKKKTGWEGYDLAINWKTVSNSESMCAKRIDGKWKIEAKVVIGYQGKNLEVSVPNTLFPRGLGKGFDFKWIDNVSLRSVETLFLEGDAAPDRRFNFRY